MSNEAVKESPDANVRLTATGVRKAFAGREVLRGASLEARAGEVTGLLGPNGAGKTTFVSIATGGIPMDGGRVVIGGVDVALDRMAAARKFGLAPQELGVYPMLTVRENVISMAQVQGVPSRQVGRRSDEVIEALGLTGCASIRAEQLSGGQRRRVHTAMALVHSPGLVFLDEPTVGADVQSRRQIVAYVRRLADEGAAVVYTTHYLSELEEMQAQIAVLLQGRISRYGSAREVVDIWGASELRIRLAGSVGSDDQLATPEHWARQGDWLVRTSTDIAPGRALAAALNELGDRAAEVVDVSVERSSLERAYLRILQNEVAEEGRVDVEA